MRLTRQEDVSLYFYIRDQVVAPQALEWSENYGLDRSTTNKWDILYEESLGIHPFKRDSYTGLGRGLAYFDLLNDMCVFGSEQVNMIQVKDTLQNVVDAQYYTVNYLTGQIYSDLDLTNYMVDYYWHYVSVIDSWPSSDVPDLPIISIDLQYADSSPLQLGGGDIRNADWHIEVFATNKGERDDLMDIIYEGLHQRRCPIYTFSNGLPLLREGVFNLSFSLNKNANYPHLAFEDVEKHLTSLPRWGFYESETINKYRAGISFSTKAYKK